MRSVFNRPSGNKKPRIKASTKIVAGYGLVSIICLGSGSALLAQDNPFDALVQSCERDGAYEFETQQHFETPDQKVLTFKGISKKRYEKCNKDLIKQQDTDQTGTALIVVGGIASGLTLVCVGFSFLGQQPSKPRDDSTIGR